MKSELALINKLLTVKELHLRETDYIEIQKALFGKGSVLLYTVVAVCCAAALGIYGIAKQIGIGQHISTGVMYIALLCLMGASLLYSVVPRWLGKTTYLRKTTHKSIPRSVDFYNNYLEIKDAKGNTKNYLYSLIIRTFISENLYIVVLPDMILPIRCTELTEEEWNHIQQCITAAIKKPKAQSSVKNSFTRSILNSFTKLVCSVSIFMVLSLILISCASIEAAQVNTSDEIIASIYGTMVSEQSFDLSLNDWGAVTFVSCMPDPDAEADPLTDASFYLISDGDLLYRFPYVAENNVRETGLCESISFVFFADSNEDLRDDVIIGVQYVSGAGPQGMIPYTEVRIYEDSGNSSFVYNGALSYEINTNLPVDVTAEYVKEFLANYVGERSQ